MLIRFERFPRSRRLFEDLFNFNPYIDSLFGDSFGAAPALRVRNYPLIDLAEYDDQSVVTAELPGLNKDDVKISVQNGTLTISGERKPHTLPENSTWVRNERWTGDFSRSIQLPHEVNVDKISAELTNGVLTVKLFKTEEVKAREIHIN